MILTQRVKNLLPAYLPTTILKNFFVYSFGALALRGISILSAPITMSILSPRDYGLLALINSFITISTIICGMGLRQALSLEFFHCTPEQRVTMIADMITIYLLCTIPTIGILLWNYPLINTYFFVGDATPKMITVSFAIIGIYFFVELIYQILQYLGKAQELTLLQTGCAVITLLLNLSLLYFFHLGIYSIIIGQFIGMLLVCAITLKRHHQTLPLHAINIKRSMRMTGTYLAQGLPFIPTVLFGFILASGDRWALAQLTTLHHVGIYSLADMFGQLFQFIILIPFSNAYLPALMTKFSQNPTTLHMVEQENKKIMWASMIGTFILITLGYLCAKPVLLYVLPPAYHEAITYIWLLLIGYIFLMGTYFLSSLIQFQKKRYFLAFSLIIPALLNMALNFALIPPSGHPGMRYGHRDSLRGLFSYYVRV